MNVSIKAHIAFELQFKQLYLPLGMYALRMLGSVECAEDAVQEAFAKTWEQICSGLEIENFKAYMYRSVRNQCLSHLRSAVATEPIDDCGDVEEDVIDTSERDAQLWRAIDDLPKRCREVFLLSKHDGLSNAEIADELNVSIKTVENQITKAYSRLRAALGERHSKVFFLPFL